MQSAKEQLIIRHDFEARVLDYIRRHGLLRPGAPVIVALSGGADSVALLAVLEALGFECRAAHCNFHLRGEESQRDMHHAEAIAEALGVDLSVRDFDVAARMKITGESVEMACRELRYEWFNNLLDRESAQALAVGHHSEDRTETFFLNLFRGTGIDGLTSMRPVSGNVVRPLLEMTRGEIERYLEACGLTFVNDSSNSSDAHKRNIIRNRLMPLIEEFFPGSGNSVLRTVSNLESARRIFADTLEAKKLRYRSAFGPIQIRELADNEPEAATILFEWIKGMKFNFRQVEEMIENSAGSGTRYISLDGKVIAEITRGSLVFTDAATLSATRDSWIVNPFHDILEPAHITIDIKPVAAFALETPNPDTAFFDADILEGNPVWELRHYRRGDRMVPYGARKSKLVSDIFANAKLDARQKRDTWILTRDDEILWIPGVKNSGMFTIGPETRRYVRMQLFNS